MSEDWPAPESVDESATTSARRPAARSRQSYALRQATVLLAVLVAAAAVVALVVSWGDDDPDQTSVVPTVEPRRWDSIVLVDATTDRLIVSAADGRELATGPTTLGGLLDVGLDGVVVAGAGGTGAAVGSVDAPSVAGLGVVELATGRVEQLAVAHDRLVRLGDTALLVASDNALAVGSVQLVDVARRRVSELAPLAGSGAVVLPDEIRASPDGRHVAFTDLSRSATVVLDTATGTTATVPGTVADLSADRVVTITNRGATVLVDLHDLRGTRIGTIETPPLAGVLATGPTTAIAVATTGAVLRLDIAEATSSTSAQVLATTGTGGSPTTDASGDAVGDSTAPSTPATAAVLDVGIVAARQRLAVVVAGAVALVDTEGVVAATVEVSVPQPRLDAVRPGARCLHVVGSAVEPSLLIDATTGTKVAALPAAALVARSADGCVAVVQPLGSTLTSIVGDGIELEVGDPVLAVAPDGAAILIGGARPRLVLLDDEATEVALPRSGTAGSFATLGQPR